MASQRFAKVRQRFAQVRVLFVGTRRADPRFLPLLLGVPAVVLVVVVGLAALLGFPGMGMALGILLATLAAMLIFGRRSQAAALRSIEGRPGSAAAVLQQMRGPWIVTPGVAYTRKQDLVHRVVGRPGVIMVGEGSPARVASMLKQERRKVARVVGAVPVHEVSVGDGENQVSLRRLQNHLTRLPRVMKARQVGPLDTRLQALDEREPPIPKGPIPRGRPRAR